MYSKIESTWELRRRNSVANVPNKYVFHLRCCYQDDCIHPRCKKWSREVEPSWYPEGPPLSFVPQPAVDPEWPYGWSSCAQCQQTCSGHYLKPEPLLESYKNGSYAASKPPSDVFLSKIKALKYEIPSDSCVLETSKDVLLPPDETRMWFDHLRQIHLNRVEEPKKAAEKRSKNVPKGTRKQKAKTTDDSDEQRVCLMCDNLDPPAAQNSGYDEHSWIRCDGCTNWCHGLCAGFAGHSKCSATKRLCLACSDNWV